MTHHNDRLGHILEPIESVGRGKGRLPTDTLHYSETPPRGRLHDADEVVGRILAHSYRDEIPPVVVWQAAPEEREHPVKVVGVILAQMAVLLLLFVGLGMWAWIGWAAQ